MSTFSVFWLSYGRSGNEFCSEEGQNPIFDPLPRNEKLCGNLYRKFALRNGLKRAKNHDTVSFATLINSAFRVSSSTDWAVPSSVPSRALHFPVQYNGVFTTVHLNHVQRSGKITTLSFRPLVIIECGSRGGYRDYLLKTVREASRVWYQGVPR